MYTAHQKIIPYETTLTVTSLVKLRKIYYILDFQNMMFWKTILNYF